jgi:3-dehydroquinate synthase
MKISYEINKEQYHVNFLDKSYEKIGNDLEKLGSDKKVLFIFDQNINKKTINEIYLNLKFSGCKIYELEFLGNKKNKSLKSVLKIIDFLMKEGFTKKSVIICLGGGVLGDLCGLAASLYMRGLLYFNIPSTMTAMIDSCIGGKTAINYQNIINSVGTYYHANNVYIFSSIIDLLPDREFFSGIPEILKCGLIKKNRILKLLEKDHLKIKKRDKKIVKILCLETLKTKLHFFINDVNEKNTRLMLNFGHTFAHSIEMATGFFFSDQDYLRHGEAVGVGMLCELNYANGKNNIYKKVEKILKIYDLPTNLSYTKNFIPLKMQSEIFKNVFLDKKKINKNPRYISIPKIGYPKISEMKDFNKINDVINDIL